MNILTIATAIAIIVLGYVTLPRIRRAFTLRKAGVPNLPKRSQPPPLPREAEEHGMDALEMARRRRYEAMGIEDDFGRPGRWP
ncbi:MULTISPECIES: hypothetical protein [unclassified Rhodanobacter]|uniref:hypothetical protein n=1 Tax=unclassified Rhodanobacter TaxID=2621553 RepID=UPI0007A9B487|nr:hypothetical protein [Rhodanobacter sp. FW510-R10]KZC32656.1 hypothetical protein RhoFW510R10_12135 [Rhodanobacter sp. FW510-R10]